MFQLLKFLFTPIKSFEGAQVLITYPLFHNEIMNFIEELKEEQTNAKK